MNDILNSADLQGFIDGATVGIHSVDESGTIIYANQAEMDLLGYSKEEYFGKNIFEFHADQLAITDIFRSLKHKHTVVDHPAKLLCKDGSIRDVLINSSARYLWYLGQQLSGVLPLLYEKLTRTTEYVYTLLSL